MIITYVVLCCSDYSFGFLLQELVRQILSAIRAVAGNDDVKDAVANAGGVQLIVIVMNRHISSPLVS